MKRRKYGNAPDPTMYMIEPIMVMWAGTCMNRKILWSGKPADVEMRKTNKDMRKTRKDAAV
jgi:hypothetical protein